MTWHCPLDRYRVRAIEYDGIALAAQLAAKENAGKKEDEEAMPKPISSKDRDRVARNLFVERVKFIYTTSLSKELSSGTAISYTTTFGLDPGRLLREGDEESERKTRKALQLHIAENLYFMKNIEWEIGGEGFKEKKLVASRRSVAQRAAAVRGFKQSIYIATVGKVVQTAAAAEMKAIQAREQVAEAKRRMEAAVSGEEADEKPAASKYKQKDDSSKADAKRSGPSKLQKWAQRIRDAGKSSLPVIVEEARVERLEEAYREPDECDEENAQGGDTGAPALGGDNLLGPLSIDDYMLFRTRPLCTYLERTAPWRAFEQQFLEILVFSFNSLGAVLVGLGMAAYVPLTVSVSAIISSFMDFINISKQVEAYNASINNVHNLVNEWDGKTRTERRTRQTVAKVVSTTEEAWLAVALALTNGSPTGSNNDDDEGEEGEEEK
jgi:hypothetical protein